MKKYKIVFQKNAIFFNYNAIYSINEDITFLSILNLFRNH